MIDATFVYTFANIKNWSASIWDDFGLPYCHTKYKSSPDMVDENEWEMQKQ